MTPRYFSSLVVLFFLLSCSRSDILTKSEKGWLNKHPNLVVGLSPNAPPYQFINENGEEVGIFIDFLTIIENRLDYKFKRVYQSDFSKLLTGTKEGSVDVLLEIQKTSERQQEYIEIIGKSGRRMLGIINDIVDISKIEAGLMTVELAESDINKQIEYVYTFFKPEIEAKGLKFSVKNSLSSKEATLITDREKLYAILTNLVKNAIKYTEKGTIEFGYNQVETHGRASLQFYIKDTGIGIPKTRHQAIFERFIQADYGYKRAFEGAGLGLAITKSYVEMLGGRIWVDSAEGKGSIFYFTLPYIVQLKDNNDIQKGVPAEGIAKQFNPNGLRLKILIAEDDEISQMLISKMVGVFGKEIIKVKDGLEAVEACRNNPDIDLILMDIQMLRMNGHEATRLIRQFNNDIVIIAQTAFALSGDNKKAIEAGCNGYISKPVNKDELFRLIQKLFKNIQE